MLQAIVTCFITACCCPSLLRRFPRCRIVLPVIPLILFCHFMRPMQGLEHGSAVIQTLSWLPDLGIDLSFRLDGLSNLFAILICGIGVFIVLYSGTYLRHHEQLGRFYAYLFFFMGAMLGLVLAQNLIVLFVFWELTGLASFLLIGFNHGQADARRAALQSLLVTALGGLALLAAFILIKIAGGTFDLDALLRHGRLAHDGLYSVIVILALIGAFTKSAQFPFHFWLPNAMQAPTPVSAYLHSATMVQAGVYLVARLTPVLGHGTLWFYTLTCISTVTIMIAMILALQSRDIKRILAYSTVMALGMSMFLLASGEEITVSAAIMFFFAHALYKAGLFLAAGNIDHAAGERDIYRLGGLRRRMPWTFAGTLLCAASMAGLPPLLGFVGKEMIYAAKLSLGNIGYVLLVVAFFGNVTFALIAGMFVIKPFFGRAKNTTALHKRKSKHGRNG